MVRLLVTGFGTFPGVRDNPSTALVRALQTRRARFARLGINLDLRILPVIYAGLEERIAKLCAETVPDGVLHFGLARRRTCVSVETLARNRVSALHGDAAASTPGGISLAPSGPASIRVRVPASQIVAHLRRAGIAAELSRDAGTYVCNALLYHSLYASHGLPVGFVHIPWPAARGRHAPGRPAFAALVKAAEIAIRDIAIMARRGSGDAVQRNAGSIGSHALTAGSPPC